LFPRRDLPHRPVDPVRAWLERDAADLEGQPDVVHNGADHHLIDRLHTTLWNHDNSIGRWR
jgi:hypothetical protein